MTRESAVRREEPGDTVTVLALFDDVRGCEKFAQRLLSFGAGSSKTRLAPSDDELFYVLEGRAELHVDGDYAALRPGIGVYLRRGTRWSVECDRSLELVSVLVRSPAPGSAAHAEVDLAAAARSSATASRQFVLGIGPEHGCPS